MPMKRMINKRKRIIIICLIGILLAFILAEFNYIVYPRKVCITKDLSPAIVKIENNHFRFSSKNNLEDFVFGRYNVRIDDIEIRYPGVAIKLYFHKKAGRWFFLKIHNLVFAKDFLRIWFNNNPVDISGIYFDEIVKVFIPEFYQRKGFNYLYISISEEKAKVFLFRIDIFNQDKFLGDTKDLGEDDYSYSFSKDGEAVWVAGNSEIDYYIMIPEVSYLEYYVSYKDNLKEAGEDFVDFALWLEADGNSKYFAHKMRIKRREGVEWEKHIEEVREFSNKIARLRIKIDGIEEKNLGKISIGMKIWFRGRDYKEGKRRRKNEPLNVMLIILDAASASHFSCYGYPRKTTPNIDEFSKKSILFTNAYTTQVSTRGSTSSLFTSLYPSVHNILNLLYKLPKAAKTLAEIFQENGYETVMFTTNGNASEQSGLRQGFKEYKELFHFSPEKVSEEIIKWLKGNGDKHFFLYAHYREPHAPFNAPFELRKKFNNSGLPTLINNSELIEGIYRGTIIPDEKELSYFISQYDANLNYVDQAIGRLMKFIFDNKLNEKTVIILTSDHGEAMGEHEGMFGHGRNLNKETIWIPLIVWVPFNDKNKRINELIENIDLAPTLIDLLNLKVDFKVLQGKSFASCFYYSKCKTKDEIFSESSYQRYYSIINKDYHMIYDKEENYLQLYKLAEDAKELHNAADRYPIAAAYFKDKLLKYLKVNNRLKQTLYKSWNREEFQPSPEVIENLKALGYIK